MNLLDTTNPAACFFVYIFLYKIIFFKFFFFTWFKEIIGEHLYLLGLSVCLLVHYIIVRSNKYKNG